MSTSVGHFRKLMLELVGLLILVSLTMAFLTFQVLLSEIGSRFVTLPEERLLAVVNALLHRCYKYPTATTGEVPQSLKKELSGVCRACFSADAVNKHVEFVREYKQEFERDLDPERAATFPATLSELTERLKHWKNVLQSNVEDRFPAVLKLEEESKVLHDFHVVDVEMPGQYFTDQVGINLQAGVMLILIKMSFYCTACILRFTCVAGSCT